MEEQRRQRPSGWRRAWLMTLDSAARASFEKRSAAERRTSRSEWLATLRARHVVKTQRFLAGMHLLDSVIPGLEAQCAEALLDFSQLPFADQNLKLIGAGLGQNVYVFQTSQGKMVVKIDRESQALDFPTLLAEARRVKAEHEQIREWYAHIPDFIPQESFCIVSGPLKGRRALATLQPFIEQPFRGVFEDFTSESFVALLRSNPILFEMFCLFVQRTAAIFREQGMSIDLLGDRNLVVCGTEVPTLYFVDPHDIYGVGRMSRYPDRYGTIADRITYLETLLEMATP